MPWKWNTAWLKAAERVCLSVWALKLKDGLEVRRVVIGDYERRRHSFFQSAIHSNSHSSFKGVLYKWCLLYCCDFWPPPFPLSVPPFAQNFYTPPFSAFVCFSFDPPTIADVLYQPDPLSPGWISTSVWMHITWQFLSPVATQVNGMHENWKWSKNDILWRKDLNASAAPLCPKIM